MRYIIIGNGVAGIEASLSIRSINQECSIQIFESSQNDHYYRPGLTEYVKGKIQRDKLFVVKKELLASKKIDVLLGKQIIRIDSLAKKIIDSNNMEYDYDSLLIATGSMPYNPPIANSSVSGVFTLRTIDDADMIRSWCSGDKDLVISGGGLLGIETACALVQSARSVTVVDISPRVLSRQLDEDGSSFLQNKIEKMGVSFFTNTTVKKIIGDSAVSGAELSNGKIISADAMIISAGVVASTELAQAAGILVHRGIVIDSKFSCGTNVYAAGDCAEFDGSTFGLWTVAKEQGHLAGLSMAGEKIEYKGSVPSSALKVSGIDLFSAGDISGKKGCMETFHDDNRYIKLWHNDEKIIGIIVIGDFSVIQLSRKIIGGTASINELLSYIRQI